MPLRQILLAKLKTDLPTKSPFVAINCEIIGNGEDCNYILLKDFGMVFLNGQVCLLLDFIRQNSLKNDLNVQK